MRHNMLIEAQMHLECMAEAFQEMERGGLDEDRQEVIYQELIDRLWAAIHLVQSFRLGRDDGELGEALIAARHYNSDGAPSAGSH